MKTIRYRTTNNNTLDQRMNVQDIIVTAVLPSPFTTTINENDRITRINNQPAADFYMDAISNEARYEYEGISASGDRFHG